MAVSDIQNKGMDVSLRLRSVLPQPADASGAARANPAAPSSDVREGFARGRC